LILVDFELIDIWSINLSLQKETTEFAVNFQLGMICFGSIQISSLLLGTCFVVRLVIGPVIQFGFQILARFYHTQFMAEHISSLCIVYWLRENLTF